MILEGVVTNVAAFGAFVDIGVHQDGLVHISAMSKTFVKDPRSVAKPGDIVRVKVLEVDAPRKRIGLSLRLDDEAQPRNAADPRNSHGFSRSGQTSSRAPAPEQKRAAGGAKPAAGGALGEALLAALRATSDKAK